MPLVYALVCGRGHTENVMSLSGMNPKNMLCSATVITPWRYSKSKRKEVGCNEIKKIMEGLS